MILTMSRRHDVAVVGLGAMGAAVAWRLARRGASVVGFDRYRPPHTLGSTHGRSRIIREAYYEHPQYVPIVQRAYDLWAELETAGRVRLFQACGGLMIGTPESRLMTGARASAVTHHLSVQEWTASELRARVPALMPSPGMIALFEPRAGVLDPERGVTTMLAQAAAQGADLRFDTPIAHWETTTDEVVVTSTGGDVVRAGQLVLAAGGWLPQLLPDLSSILTIERAVQYWFPPASDDRYSPAKLPIFLLETPDGRWLYGLPDQGHGVKLAAHHEGEIASVDSLRRHVSPDEQACFRALAALYVAGLASTPLDASVCIYTNTPDEHFLLDRHPRHPKVYVMSACSGHGFKFAPALGELVAHEVLEQTPTSELAPFRLSRFKQDQGAAVRPN
jgi:sarcosine oxidase